MTPTHTTHPWTAPDDFTSCIEHCPRCSEYVEARFDLDSLFQHHVMRVKTRLAILTKSRKQKQQLEQTGNIEVRDSLGRRSFTGEMRRSPSAVFHDE